MSLLEEKFNEIVVFEEAISAFYTTFIYNSNYIKGDVFDFYKKELSSQQFESFIDIFGKLIDLKKYLTKECLFVAPVIFSYTTDNLFYTISPNNFPIPNEDHIKYFNPNLRFKYFYEIVKSSSSYRHKLTLEEVKNIFTDWDFHILWEKRWRRKRRFFLTNQNICFNDCFINKIDYTNLSKESLLPFRMLILISKKLCYAPWSKVATLWINSNFDGHSTDKDIRYLSFDEDSSDIFEHLFNFKSLIDLKKNNENKFSYILFIEAASYVNFLYSGRFECFYKSYFTCKICTSNRKKNKIIRSLMYKKLKAINDYYALNYNIPLNICEPYQPANN